MKMFWERSRRENYWFFHSWNCFSLTHMYQNHFISQCLFMRARYTSDGLENVSLIKTISFFNLLALLTWICCLDFRSIVLSNTQVVKLYRLSQWPDCIWDLSHYTSNKKEPRHSYSIVTIRTLHFFYIFMLLLLQFNE